MLNRELLYDAPQQEFFKDVVLNKFTDKMENEFLRLYGRKPGDSERRSWRESGKEIKNILELSELQDIYLSFEYQVPYTQKRIDCLLFGKNEEGRGMIIHIEMKQWESVEALSAEGNFVETYTGGDKRKVAHPSQQVQGYHNYLIGFVEIFEESDTCLVGCVYCPNYNFEGMEGLFDPRYKELIAKFPIYTKSDIEILAARLKFLLSKKDGFDIFNKFMESPKRPSRKLLDNASNVIKNESDFNLLDDQIYARNLIIDKVKKAEHNQENSAIIVKGAPGTGKTVIALHILAEFAANKEKKYKIFFASRSKPLIEAIKYKMEHGQKVGDINAKVLFTNLNPFVPARINENELDILIVDEAHRIGEKSDHRFTKKEYRTNMPQIEQLIRCAKTSIFFIDDRQVIRGAEVGNTNLIRESAKKLGKRIEETELLSQFRCNGSDNYLDWLESVLGHTSTKLILTKEDNFDFQIFNSPKLLYQTITEKNSQKGVTARLVAGYCWPWSTELDQTGNLVRDVKIEDFSLPWETHGNIKPPQGYVPWYEWAYKPEGIKQVGCIYTVQGFEFDYVGVIVGPDLKYDSKNKCLITDIGGTKDPMLKKKKDRLKFDEYVKNIYRVLMSRGIKGCYVYFVDKEVENYFRSRMKI
ncbi:MAG: DUF2075 domain-containing protein [Candidatus Woesearchaeota archaeon]|nr:DUF2075 domain-containing protein [Candidatus Woesearchaeota archaeon]